MPLLELIQLGSQIPICAEALIQGFVEGAGGFLFEGIEQGGLAYLLNVVNDLGLEEAEGLVVELEHHCFVVIVVL